MVFKNLDHLFEKPHMTSALDGEYFNIWPGWDHLNSGFMVIEPSHELFLDILQFAKSFPKDSLPDYIVADQEILNLYYKDWPNHPELHVNKYYDIFPPYVHEEHIEELEKECYFVHYVGRKPWMPFLKLPEETYSEYYYTLGREKVESILNTLNWQEIFKYIKITVYAICKNEKKYINNWIKCFSKADYLCVLDTGSTDGTWEILQKESKKRKNLIIDQTIISPWRYDKARNESMRLIPNDTIMYFMMDLDELIKTDDWVEKIRTAWTPNFSRGMYTYYRDISADGVVQKTMREYRIHSNKWHKWVNIVHEALVDENGEKYFFEFECTPIDIEVWHYADQTRSKPNYAELCEAELKENPNNTLMRLQLAIEYEILEEYEKAYEHFYHLLKDKKAEIQDFEKARCYYGVGHYYYIKANYVMAMDYYREGRLLAPYYADNYIGGAETYIAMNNNTAAIETLEAGLKSCKSLFWCSLCDIDFWYTYFLLGKAQFNAGNYIKGLGYIAYAESFGSNKPVDEIKNEMLTLLKKQQQAQKKQEGLLT